MVSPEFPLRFLYGISRFSEDLDFSLHASETISGFRDAFTSVKQNLSREGYPVEVKVNHHKTVANAWVRFPGLPHALGFSARSTQVISIKVEVDTNPPTGATLGTTIVRRHAMLNLCHHDRASLLSGKLHALLSRPWTKGRDLYDLFWYLSDRAWPAPNLPFLNNALVQTGWANGTLTPRNWRRRVLDRITDLDWNTARADVKPFLERDRDIDLLTLPQVKSLLITRA